MCVKHFPVFSFSAGFCFVFENDIRNAKNKRFLPAACLMSDKQKKAFVCQNNVTI